MPQSSNGAGNSFTEPTAAPADRTYRTQGALADFSVPDKTPGQTVGGGQGFGVAVRAFQDGDPVLPNTRRAGEETDAMKLQQRQVAFVQEGKGNAGRE